MQLQKIQFNHPVETLFQLGITILQLYVFRNDNYDSSLTTLLQLGASFLRVGLAALGEGGQVPGQQSSLFASKIGVVDQNLSPEQMLHQQKVFDFKII